MVNSVSIGEKYIKPVCIREIKPIIQSTATSINKPDIMAKKKLMSAFICALFMKYYPHIYMPLTALIAEIYLQD